MQTYETLNGTKDTKIYIHHYLREDDELYYGFATKNKREMFRILIGISRIGASTARMMLSSLTSEEIRNAILAEDINKIKSIKGIGLKSAQRLILELKDKVSKGGGADNSPCPPGIHKGKRYKGCDSSAQRKAERSIGGNNQARIETIIKKEKCSTWNTFLFII